MAFKNKIPSNYIENVKRILSMQNDKCLDTRHFFKFLISI